MSFPQSLTNAVKFLEKSDSRSRTSPPTSIFTLTLNTHTHFVPYGLDLSNFIDDFQVIRNLHAVLQNQLF